MQKVWEWIEYNRFLVLGPLVCLGLWFYAGSCTPLVESPRQPGLMVTAKGLESEVKVWQAEQQIMTTKFEAAGESLKEQAEQNAKITQMIIALSSQNIADMPGLITILLGGGGLGAIADNIRKRGLIAGLKKNK